MLYLIHQTPPFRPFGGRSALVQDLAFWVQLEFHYIDVHLRGNIDYISNVSFNAFSICSIRLKRIAIFKEQTSPHQNLLPGGKNWKKN